MRVETFKAFLSELTKIGSDTAFGKKYQRLYGPKLMRKDKKFYSPKDNVPASQYTSLTNNDSYSPISNLGRALEGRETPGGP